DLHVGAFKKSAAESAQTVGPRRSVGCRAGSRGLGEKIAPLAAKAGRVGKSRKVQRSNRRRGIWRTIGDDRNDAIGSNRNRDVIVWQRNRRLYLVSVGGNKLAIGVDAQSAVAGVPRAVVRPNHLDKTIPFDGDIERIPGVLQSPWLKNMGVPSHAHAVADLQ